jgi:hypothetical protein
LSKVVHAGGIRSAGSEQGGRARRKVLTRSYGAKAMGQNGSNRDREGMETVRTRMTPYIVHEKKTPLQ